MVVLWTIISGPGSLVTSSKTVTEITGREQLTITSDEVGTTIIRATAASLDISGEAEIIWIAAEETLYFTVDFLGEITRVPMSPDGSIMAPLTAPSPDGLHLFEMVEGTRVLDAEGNIITLIEIRDTEELNIEPDMVIITAL